MINNISFNIYENTSVSDGTFFLWRIFNKQSLGITLYCYTLYQGITLYYTSINPIFSLGGMECA